MRQIQKQTQTQKLALTQTMRHSLALLAMGPEEVLGAIQREQNRNAFLCSTPPSTPSGGAHIDIVDLAMRETEIGSIERQIGLIRLSRQQAELAHGLLHSLDDRGFLSDSPGEIASYLKCQVSALFELVPILQSSVEPAGVFAWSLADCCRLQLEARNRFDPLIEKLLGRLDLVARQDVEAICSEWGVDREDATDMLNDIRSLNPAPLQRRPDLQHIQTAPELIFKTDSNGACTAVLNEAALPRILTDDALFSAVIAAETDGHAQSYYRDCYRGAANMVKAMQKRANTLLSTGQAIAERQQKFIRSGRERDKLPLTIAKLADQLGINKSTVSRVLNHCSIMTDRGTIPAHDFFAQALTADGKHDKTRQQALQRLALLIKTEDPKKPFADKELTVQLKKSNFDISRRTVAKYRKMLGIPGTHVRSVP